LNKKSHKPEGKQVPTKRQLSKWQREKRTRQVIVRVAAAFFIGIIGYVGYNYYHEEIKPSHEIAIEVNNTAFNMRYYAEMMDALVSLQEITPEQLHSWANLIANQVNQQIIEDALIEQGASDIGISITPQEVDNKIEAIHWPDKKAYQDIARASLLGEKLIEEHFIPNLPDEMEQMHLQVMLVESEQVASTATSNITGGGNFTDLIGEFSCNSQLEGDLGWLPQELIPNELIANATTNLSAGDITSTYDASATKNVGYWLIKVTDKKEDEINAKAMLLSSEQEALQIKTSLISGGNFTQLAETYSQHESHDNGGELGWIKKGDMNSPQFDEVAFNATVGEVANPVKDTSVQTTGGWWIINMLGEGQHELSEGNQEKLGANSFNNWFQEQKESSSINIYIDDAKIAQAIAMVLKES
jgi:parvulin-like peptidyl-prolyl isomerase